MPGMARTNSVVNLLGVVLFLVRPDLPQQGKCYQQIVTGMDIVQDFSSDIGLILLKLSLTAYS
jgi:hypothetical protein